MTDAVELKTRFLLARAPPELHGLYCSGTLCEGGALDSRPERGTPEPRYGHLEPMRGLSFGVDCLGLKGQERHHRCTELASLSGGFHGKTSELDIDSRRKVAIRR